MYCMRPLLKQHSKEPALSIFCDWWERVPTAFDHLHALFTLPREVAPNKPLNWHITLVQPSAFSSDLFIISLAGFPGSGSPFETSNPHLIHCGADCWDFLCTIAEKTEQRPIVPTDPGSTVRVIQQSWLGSSVLCRKPKPKAAAHLLVSTGVACFWSGSLQKTVRLEKMVFSTVFFSLPHASFWPFPFSGSFFLSLPLLCVHGCVDGWWMLPCSLSLSQIQKSSPNLQ